MKKIVLIEPQSAADHVYKTVRMPRLGLPILGAQLKASGYEVSLYMNSGAALPWEQILAADLVGISTTTATSREAYRIAGYVRSHNIPVVIGGIHATFMPDEAIQYGDYVLRGEADTTFLPLVRALEAGNAPENIPGVSYWQGDQAVHNPVSSDWVDMDDLPEPDLTLLPDYRKLRSIPVMTSRGCPFNCTFCCVTRMFGRRYRFRDTEKVLRELSRYRHRFVFFCDDNFTADRRRSRELLQGMLEAKINLKGWGAQVRVEVARDLELMQLMRRAGCKILYVGLESINPATLESYHKQQNLEDIREFIRVSHEHGIRVHGMFVFGGDEDTVQTIRDTVDFSLENRIDSVQYLMLTPLPGTPLFKQLEAEGRLLTRDWELYDGHHVVFQPSLMSPEQLQKETMGAFKRFYSLRHMFQNVRLTGWSTSLYRGIGYWLIRRFERHNRHYDRILAGLQHSSDRTVPLFYRRLVSPAAAAGQENASPAAAGNLLKIYVAEGKGVLYMRLRGIIESFPCKELNRIMKGLVPKRYFHVVVNTEGLSLASEKAVQSFTGFLEKLGDRVRRLQVVARRETVQRRFQGKKYRLRLPRFELLLN